MARADVLTALSLDRFAQIMGMNPMHFNGAEAPNTELMPLDNACSDLTPQFGWQYGGRVGRQEFADEIFAAEREIEAWLGFPLAPRWISSETHQYPRIFVPDGWGGPTNTRGLYKEIKSARGWIVTGGRRAVSSIGTATVAGGTLTFVDEDGDGLAEIAKIVLATSLTSTSEIKVYFPSKSQSPLWEVRDPKSIAISGGNVTIKFWVWQVILPTLWDAFPSNAGFSGINIGSTGSLVTSLEVYREYTDATTAASEFAWASDCLNCSGSGCALCSPTTQTGCLAVISPELGIVRPFPASYSATDAAWSASDWSVGQEPDTIKLWYKAGMVSDEYNNGLSNDPLSHQVARAIAFMTVARIERDVSECANVSNLTTWLREELTRLTEGASFFTPQTTSTNPFGTKRGEVIAWRAISNFVRRVPRGGVV